MFRKYINQHNLPDLKTRFEERYIPEPNSGCWLWMGHVIGKTGNEYPILSFNDKHIKAHRFSYQQYKGELIKGLVIHHKCNNPLCVNPQHLEQITQKENLLLGNGKMAKQKRQTHCIHGHLLEENNLYIKPNGARQCKVCRRQKAKEKYANSKGRI